MTSPARPITALGASVRTRPLSEPQSANHPTFVTLRVVAMKSWHGVRLRCAPMTEGKVELSRMEIQASPVLHKKCPADSSGSGFDVLLEGRIISPYLIDCLTDVLQGHSVKRSVPLLLGDTGQKAGQHVFWEFALLLQDLGMEEHLASFAAEFAPMLKSESPAKLRALFKLDDDFSPHDKAANASEETSFRKAVVANWMAVPAPDGEEMSGNDRLSISEFHDLKSQSPADKAQFGVGKDEYSHLRDKHSAAQRTAESALADGIKPRNAELVPLESVKKCTRCEKEFTSSLFGSIPKYNCNLCGRVFCGDCSSIVNIQPSVGAAQAGGGVWAASLRGLFSFGAVTQTSRVCKFCMEERRDDPHTVRVISQALFALCVDPMSLLRVRFVCNLWKAAALECMTTIREMQYHPSEYILATAERRYLLANKQLFVGHHSYLFQIAKATDWDDADQAMTTIELLASPDRRADCWYLFCRRECRKHRQQMSEAHALAYLGEDFRHKTLRRMAVNRLASCTDEFIEIALPLLVHNIQYEDTLVHSPLVVFLLSRAKTQPVIRVNLFWLLTTWAETKDPLARHMYNAVVQKLLIETARGKPGDAEALTNMTTFVTLLEAFPVEECPLRMLIIEEVAELLSTTPMPFIVDPNMTLKSIDLANAQIAKSATAPLAMDYVCVDKDGLEHRGRVMYKKDDIRRDCVIISMIRLVRLLEEEKNSDVARDIVTYNVVPTSSTRGFVQFVPESETVFDIIETKKNSSITSWVIDQGKGGYDELRLRAARSTAAMAVVAFVFGIGDRHLENIMVRKDGVLFHIDYGFCLGEEPNTVAKNLMPVIPLSKQLMEAIGQNDQNKAKFRKSVEDMFKLLRRNVDLFSVMFSLFGNVSQPLLRSGNLNRTQLSVFIRERFRPSLDTRDAMLFINNLLDVCLDATGGKVVNVLHSTAKTARETIRQLLNTVWSPTASGLAHTTPLSLLARSTPNK